MKILNKKKIPNRTEEAAAAAAERYTFQNVQPKCNRFENENKNERQITNRIEKKFKQTDEPLWQNVIEQGKNSNNNEQKYSRRRRRKTL